MLIASIQDDCPSLEFPDDWNFHQKWDGDRQFRDYHEGRGYYKGGLWIML